MLNFLKYNPETGEIISKGIMQTDLIEQFIADGQPYIRYSGPDIDINYYKYDLSTGELVDVEPAPPPAPEIPTVLSFIAFMNLFTKDEQLAISRSEEHTSELQSH